MGESFRTFRDLDCWQACRELRLFVAREIVPLLPRDERYRLRDQVVRAGRSTTANVAEGHGRYHYLENAKFCRNARGSAYEVLDHLIAALDEGMISQDLLERAERLVEQAVRLLNGYIRYLQKCSQQRTAQETSPEYGAGRQVPRNESPISNPE